MGYRRFEDDDGDDDGPSWDDDFEADQDDDDDYTMPCPYCRRAIHEDAQRCPYCERYLSEEDGPGISVKPWWVIVGAFLCLYVIYRQIVGW